MSEVPLYTTCVLDTISCRGRLEVLVPRQAEEIGISLPNNQCQHRTLHIRKDVLPYALC